MLANHEEGLLIKSVERLPVPFAQNSRTWAQLLIVAAQSRAGIKNDACGRLEDDIREDYASSRWNCFLPPALASHFTVGHSNVLRIVVYECRMHGRCSLYLDAIAARTGVCRSTVRNALREALGLSCCRSGAVHAHRPLTNIIRIVSREEAVASVH